MGCRLTGLAGWHDCFIGGIEWSGFRYRASPVQLCLISLWPLGGVVLHTDGYHEELLGDEVCV